MNVAKDTSRTDDHEPLLTAREAAHRLRIHQKTLLKWARFGLIPHIRIGGIIRFRRSDIETVTE